MLVESFTPASLKGILFLTGPDMVAGDQGALFAEQMSALANCMKKKFGSSDTPVFYTLPAKSLTPKITKPDAIKGTSTAIEIGTWNEAGIIPILLEAIASGTVK